MRPMVPDVNRGAAATPWIKIGALPPRRIREITSQPRQLQLPAIAGCVLIHLNLSPARLWHQRLALRLRAAWFAVAAARRVR